jgi:hypothetical protein
MLRLLFVLVIGVVLATGVGLLLGANGALADPNLPDIAPHRHLVETPSGNLVEVGPRVCGDPSKQHAFNQFHFNIHTSSTAPGVGYDSLGPQHGAPGLHNHQGSDLVIRPCPPAG